jgi:hypothetical protein
VPEFLLADGDQVVDVTPDEVDGDGAVLDVARHPVGQCVADRDIGVAARANGVGHGFGELRFDTDHIDVIALRCP